MLRYFSLAKLRAQLPHVNTGLLETALVDAVVFGGLKVVRVLMMSGTQNVQSQLSFVSLSAAPCCR